MWRLRKYIFPFAAAFAFCFFLYLHKSPKSPKSLPPLPGTYQYFTNVDVRNKDTKRFGAISHHDPRYMPETKLSIAETRFTLVALLKTYTEAMKELGIETWIAHGTLLGWWWNQKMLPWDTDVDVQISAERLSALAVSKNMTEYTFEVGDDRPARKYLLDINPHYSIVSVKDVANTIDARWIDMTNGKYLDITAVHRESEAQANGRPAALFCKDNHRYEEEDLFPLQSTSMHGFDVLAPRDSTKSLRRSMEDTP